MDKDLSKDRTTEGLVAKIGELGLDDALSGYAEQGQYSPRGLEAVWHRSAPANQQF